MNVLLISFSFPPAGGVGVLRALSLAKYLPENGVRLDVLTARNAPAVGRDGSLLAQVPAGVTVHRSWTLDLPFGIRKAVKKVLSGRRDSRGPAVPAAARKDSGRGNPLKRLIANLLLPDPQVGWLPFAFPAARRIVRDRKIDLVLITVPPFSTMRLVGKLRRVFPALPIVLDFRDEWLTTTINLVSFNSNGRAREVAHRTEAEAVQDASLVVAVTEAARIEIMGRYPGEMSTKFRCIPNGFDIAGGDDTQVVSVMAAGSRSEEPDGTVLLTYLGTVYGSTDPSSFVEAVLALPASARARLRVRFIGHIETPAYRDLLLRLGETIELRDFVPQAEALRAMADTDYLLLITQDRINVAAKFYDYLGGGKPILAVVHPDGEVRRLLESTGGGRWADVGNPLAIKAMLLVVLEPTSRPPGSGSEPRRDPDQIAAFHRRPLTSRYAELLHEVGAAGQQRETALNLQQTV